MNVRTGVLVIVAVIAWVSSSPLQNEERKKRDLPMMVEGAMKNTTQDEPGGTWVANVRELCQNAADEEEETRKRRDLPMFAEGSSTNDGQQTQDDEVNDLCKIYRTMSQQGRDEQQEVEEVASE